MRTRKQQSGFAVIELVIVVVILAAIGFAGWWVYQRQHNKTTTANMTPTTSTQSPVANNVSSAPVVNSTSGLDAALNTLNQNDPSAANSSDSSQLSSQTNF